MYVVQKGNNPAELLLIHQLPTFITEARDDIHLDEANTWILKY